jgi:hypothetical protein
MTTAVSPAEIPVPAGDALWRALEADEMDDDAADERLLELSTSSRLSIDGEPDLILLSSLLVVEGKEDDYRALQHEIQVRSRRRPGRLRSALLPLLTQAAASNRWPLSHRPSCWPTSVTFSAPSSSI